MRSFLAVTALVLLTGCAASRQEVTARLGEKFIGQNVDLMVAEFGPPVTVFKMSSGGASYQWQLAGSTDIVGGNGVASASQRYCKVNVIADRSNMVVDLKHHTVTSQ